MRWLVCVGIVWGVVGQAANALPFYQSTCSQAASSRSSVYRVLIYTANAILHQQQEDGAFVMGERPPYRLSPYVANYAALGLLNAFTVTHDPRYLTAVKRWQVWYLNHLNSDGTIYDYSGAVGSWRSENNYDSTDAYAATFIRLAWRYVQVAKDPLWNQRLFTSLPKLAAGVDLTLQPNGLTMAKPGWPAMYTMDNVEVYQGWVAATHLAQAMHRPELANRYEHRATATLHAIYTLLWHKEDSNTAGHFLIGRQSNGTVDNVNQPMRWYPDQMAQLMAIAWLPRTEKTSRLYQQLRRVYFTLPAVLNTEDDLSRTVWWALATQAMGDHATLHQILNLWIDYPNTVPAVMDIGLEGHICSILAYVLSQK